MSCFFFHDLVNCVWFADMLLKEWPPTPTDNYWESQVILNVTGPGSQWDSDGERWRQNRSWQNWWGGIPFFVPSPAHFQEGWTWISLLSYLTVVLYLRSADRFSLLQETENKTGATEWSHVHVKISGQWNTLDHVSLWGKDEGQWDQWLSNQSNFIYITLYMQ